MCVCVRGAGAWARCVRVSEIKRSKEVGTGNAGKEVLEGLVD